MCALVEKGMDSSDSSKSQKLFFTSQQHCSFNPKQKPITAMFARRRVFVQQLLIESTANFKVFKHFMIFGPSFNLIVLFQSNFWHDVSLTESEKLFSFSRLRLDAERRESAGAGSCETRRKRKFNLPIWPWRRHSLLDEMVQRQARVLSIHTKGESITANLPSARNLRWGKPFLNSI